MNLNIGPGSDPKVDNWGHLGGGITGFFFAFCVAENLDADARKANRTPDRFSDEEYEKQMKCRKTWVCQYLGYFFLSAWILTLIVYFYAFVDVDDIHQDDIDSQH